MPSTAGYVLESCEAILLGKYCSLVSSQRRGADMDQQYEQKK